MKKRGRWADVMVPGGLFVRAWVDGTTGDGWSMPWFTDDEMGSDAFRSYFDETPERKPRQTQSGRWEIKDEDDEVVELPRHRKRVPHPRTGKLVMMALTDGSVLDWCFQEESP